MRDGVENVPQLVVTGEGVAAARPDCCVVGVTLKAQRATIAEALRAVTTIADSVMTTMRDTGMSDTDLPTRNLGVHDWYDKQTGQVAGHVASYSLSVVVHDLDEVPRVVEVLGDTAGDALEIQGIWFSHADPEPLQEAARRDAVADAKARAGQLADAFGLRLGPIQHITEEAIPDGIGFRAAALSSEMALPVNPGEQGVTACVTVTFELLP